MKVLCLLLFVIVISNVQGQRTTTTLNVTVPFKEKMWTQVGAWPFQIGVNSSSFQATGRTSFYFSGCNTNISICITSTFMPPPNTKWWSQSCSYFWSTTNSSAINITRALESGQYWLSIVPQTSMKVEETIQIIIQTLECDSDKAGYNCISAMEEYKDPITRTMQPSDEVYYMLNIPVGATNLILTLTSSNNSCIYTYGLLSNQAAVADPHNDLTATFGNETATISYPSAGYNFIVVYAASNNPSGFDLGIQVNYSVCQNGAIGIGCNITAIPILSAGSMNSSSYTLGLDGNAYFSVDTRGNNSMDLWITFAAMNYTNGLDALVARGNVPFLSSTYSNVFYFNAVPLLPKTPLIFQSVPEAYPKISQASFLPPALYYIALSGTPNTTLYLWQNQICYTNCLHGYSCITSGNSRGLCDCQDNNEATVCDGNAKGPVLLWITTHALVTVGGAFLLGALLAFVVIIIVVVIRKRRPGYTTV